ncbi:MAG: hypothetical protein ACMUEL_07230 [Flavobacteriales bacterium Tduv]
MIHCEGIEKEIRKMYQKGQGIKGQTAYSDLLLFNILILNNWYNLTVM